MACCFAKANDKDTKQDVKYINYQLILERHPEIGVFEDKFSVIRQGTELFVKEGQITLQSGDTLAEISDLTEIKYPILMVTDYSGGVHCCSTTTILKLEPQFKVAQLEGKDYPVKIEKLTTNKGASAARNPLPCLNSEICYRVVLRDWSHLSRWEKFASSYVPKVILYYGEDKHAVAIEEMRKRPLSKNGLENIISKINSLDYSAFKYIGNDSGLLSAEEETIKNRYFHELLEPMLNLIYSGNFPQAQVLIDRTWPGTKESKKLFLFDLKAAIKVG